MYLKYFIFSFFSFFAIDSSQNFTNDCVLNDLKDPLVFCTAIFDPVCGCDGTEYPSDCTAINGEGIRKIAHHDCGGSVFGSEIQFIKTSKVQVNDINDWANDESSFVNPDRIYSTVFFRKNTSTSVRLHFETRDSQGNVISQFTTENFSTAQNYFWYNSFVLDSSFQPGIYTTEVEIEQINNGSRELFATASFDVDIIQDAQEDCVLNELKDPLAICTFVLDPVCGCDGREYGTDCNARYGEGIRKIAHHDCGGSVFGNEIQFIKTSKVQANDINDWTNDESSFENPDRIYSTIFFRKNTSTSVRLHFETRDSQGNVVSQFTTDIFSTAQNYYWFDSFTLNSSFQPGIYTTEVEIEQISTNRRELFAIASFGVDITSNCGNEMVSILTFGSSSGDNTLDCQTTEISLIANQNCCSSPIIEYDWRNQQGSSIGSSTSSEVTIDEAGIYTLHITDGNGCTDSDQVIISFEDILGNICDDGNPNTINDVFNSSCLCVGEQISTQCEYEQSGTIVNGVECTNLIEMSNGEILNPSIDIEELSGLTFSVGDAVEFSYREDPYGGISICQQGRAVEVICIRKENVQPDECDYEQSGTIVNGVECSNLIEMSNGEILNPSIDIEELSGLTFSVGDEVEFSYREDPYGGISICQQGRTVEVFCIRLKAPLCSVGAPCNDGNPCTVGEVLDSNCNCSGGVFMDSDSDGVCDFEDACPNFDNALIGTTCNDGNSNTVNDIYLASCICLGEEIMFDCQGLMADVGDPCEDECRIGILNTSCECVDGVLKDIDNDGVCDSEDQCPNLDDSLIGLPCNDNNDCTVGEVYDSNCNCSGGIFLDIDNDGVCDIDDQCPGFDDTLIGTACDDNDGCTIGEVYDSNCNCSGGVFTDTDNDGVCNMNDLCNGVDDALIGTSCDDGNPNTVNDVYNTQCVCAGELVEFDCPTFMANVGSPCDDGDICTGDGVIDVNCNCVGGSFMDMDNDGVCDINDQCNGVADALIGTPCDDGNPNTINDVYNTQCVCTGELIEFDCPTFMANVGERCDDGDICTGDGVIDVNCNCIGGSFMDMDNDGVCDINDQCNGVADALIGTPCDDGDSNTINDVYNTQCECEGEMITFDCPTLMANFGERCDDGDICTGDGVIDVNCNCVGGSFMDMDNDGVCDINDQCNGVADALIGTPCDDGDSNTINDVYNTQCECEGEMITFDCPTFMANFGERCDDGDICTGDGVIDINCNCVGGSFMDMDNDGVCDINDQCNGIADALIGTPCDDGDSNTINDVYNNQCECEGEMITFDCPTLMANFGERCDDGDDTTENDIITSNCECLGTPIPFIPSNVYVNNVSGRFQEEIIVDVRVSGFIDKDNFAINLSFDSTLFEFVDFTFVSDRVEDFSIDNIIFAEPNLIVSSWFTPTEKVSLPEDDVLFSFSLRVLAENCKTTNIVFEDVETSLDDLGSFPSSMMDGVAELNQIFGEPCQETCETLEDILFTNIITPNVAGENDFLRFNEDAVIENSKLTILNRWGNVVYKSEEYANDWNASNNPSGVYFYILEVRGVECKKTLTVVK